MTFFKEHVSDGTYAHHQCGWTFTPTPQADPYETVMWPKWGSWTAWAAMNFCRARWNGEICASHICPIIADTYMSICGNMLISLATEKCGSKLTQLLDNVAMWTPHTDKCLYLQKYHHRSVAKTDTEYKTALSSWLQHINWCEIGFSAALCNLL